MHLARIIADNPTRPASRPPIPSAPTNCWMCAICAATSFSLLSWRSKHCSPQVGQSVSMPPSFEGFFLPKSAGLVAVFTPVHTIYVVGLHAICVFFTLVLLGWGSMVSKNRCVTGAVQPLPIPRGVYAIADALHLFVLAMTCIWPASSPTIPRDLHLGRPSPQRQPTVGCAPSVPRRPSRF